MSYSEDNLKKAADKKEWLEKKINDLETELTNLQETLSVIDNILKLSSFQPAQSIKSLKLIWLGRLISSGKGTCRKRLGL